MSDESSAEITRLTAEVERLNSELTDAYTDLNSARQENSSFTTEFKRLTAEVERLNKENALGGVIHSLFGTFLTPERYDCLAAKNARIEQLEAALEWIDQQRYTGRDTINPANGYDHAIALNERLLALMDAARAALTQEKPNE
jgi:predicted nuclease with TOPRIM domain